MFIEIVEMLESHQINIEDALLKLSDNGYYPSLLNDGRGNWAVNFEAFQTLDVENIPRDVSSSFYTYREMWKQSIYEALVYSLQKFI